jgi:uncharacterized membrane protein
MRGKFGRGEFDTGLRQAVAVVSDLLVTHFPLAADADNTNELPDAPTVR